MTTPKAQTRYDFVKHNADLRFKRIIEGKYDPPDSNGNTLLMHYAWLGDDPRVQFLCDQGIDPNARNKKGDHALHKAFNNKKFSTMLSLLHRGADPNLPNGAGWNAIQQLAQAGRADMLDVFLNKGGNPAQQTTTEKWNCWHIAALHQQNDVIALLASRMAHGFYQTDKDGKTALDLARDKGGRATIRLLQQHHARRDRLARKAVQIIDSFEPTADNLVSLHTLQQWRNPAPFGLVVPVPTVRKNR